jgi:hypothetical protein
MLTGERGGTMVIMPAAVAARPRDARGYPVPAITPWADGQPRFALTGVARTFLCAAERRCSICSIEMPPGPVYRVVGGPEAEAMAAAIEAGRPYRNNAPTQEAPGHRACMLYAAIVCPYLGRPNARRGSAADAVGYAADRGAVRGLGGAVVGFDSYEFEYADDQVRLRFSGLREFLRHELGEEQLPALEAAVAAARGPVGPMPAYLLDDEAAAQRQFDDYLRLLLG